MDVPTTEAKQPSLRERVESGLRLAGADPEDGSGYAAGGPSPDTGAVEPSATGAAGDQLTDPNAPAAVSADGTSGTQDEPTFLERFSLESIEDDNIREHVGRYVKQAQGDYTRKTQEVARIRSEAEQALGIINALRDPETRLQALAQHFDLDLELVDDEPAGQAGAQGADPGGLDPNDPVHAELLAMRQWREQREADERAQAEADQRASQEAQILAHVDDALDTYAESLTSDGEETSPLAQATRQDIIALAAAAPRMANGLPDMESAIARYEAIRAGAVQEYLATLRKGNGEVVPDLTGSSGQAQFNLRDGAERLKAANAIAERALARHA
jgi:hypothetical protein